MTRDIQERLCMFADGDVEVRRIALNMEQVEEYSPPPNPAKTVDPRFQDYQAKYGDESWELDALPPTTLAELVRENVLSVRDEKKWAASVRRENETKDFLQKASDNWPAVVKFLEDI